jgi:hypothetical protein
MSSPMTEVNVEIINGIKKFIDSVSTEKSMKAYYCYSTTSFIRERILTLKCTVMLIINGLKRSLQIELQNYFEYCSEGLSCSKQAFCDQRAKLKPEFFHDLNHVLVSNFYSSYQENVKRWKGMIFWAIDGSSVPLPETEDLKQTFGGVSNQYGEQVSTTARICVLYDVLNNIAIKDFLHPYRVSEEEVIPQCLSGLELKNKLLLFDRGYPSYWLMYLLMKKKAKFVMRVSSNANNAVKDFLASESTDLTVEWNPPYASLKKLRDMRFRVNKRTSIKIRLVKILLDTGETEVLVTNLYDMDIYTQDDLKEVYHLRWGIEKQTEPYTDSVSRKRKYQYKVNKNSSWASLKNRVVNLFLYEDSRTVLIELEKLFGNYLEPIRPGRKYPRIKKRNPNVKYYTLTNYKRAL